MFQKYHLLFFCLLASGLAYGQDAAVFRPDTVRRELKAHPLSHSIKLDGKLDEEDWKLAADLWLLTAKPVMYVCNVDEGSVVNGNAHVDAVKAATAHENAEILVIAAAIEADIAQLESFDDRKAFLDDLGLDESGVAKLIRAAYRLLKLRTYFTAGEKEVRAWTIHEGMTAPQAAGVIHTDFEKGFIRAEVIHYDDFVTLGSEQACRDAGKLAIEGKEYVVADGDLMHFRFNV